MRREASPQPPFYCATVLAPYGARRSSPLAIDFTAMRATSGERAETTVAGNVRDELERMRSIAPPVLVDAAGPAESVFRRGEEIVRYLDENDLPAVQLVSTRGFLSEPAAPTTVIAAWPIELPRLRVLFADAQERGLEWGVLVPVLYPITTELETLEVLAGLAANHGARFLAAASVGSDPPARQAIARALDLEAHDDRYAMLFHGSAEPIQTSTERHIAAVAQERGMADRMLLPAGTQGSNWSAAAFLTATASRMLAMELDLELASSIARSARIVAELDKPLSRIAASASLSIIGGLDETSVEMLGEWLSGESAAFARFVDEEWRLRRG